MAQTIPQQYPRIQDEDSPYYGYLDDAKLVSHHQRVPHDLFVDLIQQAIASANRKSSRDVLQIPEAASEAELQRIYENAGKKLFTYFRQYVSDPAGTAHQLLHKTYHEVGEELFRNRTLQKERMNSGWRYQYLAVAVARATGRFVSVSDIGAAEADFHAVIHFTDQQRYPDPLSLYVSVKNRSDTVGGQDYPKAVQALEEIAKSDRNRLGPYCGVMGIVMEKGQRRMRKNQRTGQPHSFNVEMWLSDFFWPFFTNYSYEEIMTAVLDVLIAAHEAGELSSQIMIPEPVLEAFGDACREAGLIDADGLFDDPHRLIRFFVGLS